MNWSTQHHLWIKFTVHFHCQLWTSESSEQFLVSGMCFQLRTEKRIPDLLVHLENRCPFCSVWCHMFCNYVLGLVILLFQMAPKYGVRCYLVFPSAIRVWCASSRKHFGWLSFMRWWVTALLALSLMLMIQLLLNKMFLNSNVHKRRLSIDWLMKVFRSDAYRKKICP